MGNFLSSSFVVGNHVIQVPPQVPTIPLFVLLDAPVGEVNWNLVRNVLLNEPHQAAAFAHGIDPSPLAVAISKQAPLDVVQRLVDSYPEAIEQIHPITGDTVLQVAIQRTHRQPQHEDAHGIDDGVQEEENDNGAHQDEDYVSRIEYILQRSPQLAKTPNAKSGWYPIHEPTISHPNVVDLLMKYHPNCITMKLPNGRLPLHQVLSLQVGESQPRQPQQPQQLIHRPCIDVVQAMVRLANPSSNSQASSLRMGGILVRDKQGYSPLELLCRHVTTASDRLSPPPPPPLQAMVSETASVHDGRETIKRATSIDMNTGISTNYGLQVWEVVLEWIRMIQHDQGHPNGFELHTLIEYGCCVSRPIIEQAILHDFAKQTLERDSLGRTPLHIAASSTQLSTRRRSFKRGIHPRWQGQDRRNQDQTQNEDVDKNADAIEDYLVSTLIVQNPESPRMTDSEGRLPIDVAAEYGKTCNQGLERLIEGEPRAIDTRDLRDHHYPFVSAALGKNDDTSLSTTYFLLRAKPHVLSYFHTP